MTYRSPPSETTARVVAESTGIALDVARLIACYSRAELHQILKHNDALCQFLLANDRNHPCLVYEGPLSDTYATVTKWCNPDKDLVRNKFGWMTHNGISYDAKTRSFVSLCYDTFTQFLSLKSVLIQLLPALDVSQPTYHEVGIEFLTAWHFSAEVLQQMEDAGIISGPLSVPSEFLAHS